MAEKDTTTTTTEAPDTTSTTTQVPQEELHRTDLSDDQVGAGAKAGSNPSNKEVLDSVATASPHADRDSDTKVLGHDNVSPEESQERARREALVNSQGEQDLH
jgi:hypothetical protein